MKKYPALILLLGLILTTLNVNAQGVDDEPVTPPEENSEKNRIELINKMLLDAYKELGITPDDPKNETAPSADIKSLKTVVIGSQTWTAENLNVTTFRNGDAIPEIRDDAEWEKAYDDEKPAWCYYKNDPTNGAKYGKLYNWWATIDERGLAPVGYHMPSKEEWDVLTTYLGSGAGKKMKAVTGWDDNGNGNNQSGFAAIPAGFRETPPNSFGKGGSHAYFWSSSTATFFGFDLGGGIYLKYDSEETIFDGFAAEGMAVRCIKD